jgi:8-oxo-dGTP diphosphatase
VPYTYPYPRPQVTADVAVFTLRGSELELLVVRRKHDPFAGSWALPGGFVDEDESLEHAAARELQEETGLENVPMEQLGAFGDPGRDPRGHTVTAVYLAVVPRETSRVRAGDDAAEAEWVSVDVLHLDEQNAPSPGKTSLAFDHARVVRLSLVRLRDLVTRPHEARTALVRDLPESLREGLARELTRLAGAS